MTNRDRLVLAAGELFYRNGYAATSVGDILDRTGVARSNFYYHFGGKMDLAREVLRRWARAFEEHLTGLGRDGSSPTDRLRGIFRQVAPQNSQPGDGDARIPCPLGPLAFELAPHDQVVREVTSEFLDILGGALLDVIESGAASGEFDPEVEPGPAARVALAALQGALLMCHARGGQEPLVDARDALLEVLSR